MSVAIIYREFSGPLAFRKSRFSGGSQRVNDVELEKPHRSVCFPHEALSWLRPACFFQLYTYFIVTRSLGSYRMMDDLWVMGTHVSSEIKSQDRMWCFKRHHVPSRLHRGGLRLFLKLIHYKIRREGLVAKRIWRISGDVAYF